MAATARRQIDDPLAQVGQVRDIKSANDLENILSGHPGLAVVEFVPSEGLERQASLFEDIKVEIGGPQNVVFARLPLDLTDDSSNQALIASLAKAQISFQSGDYKFDRLPAVGVFKKTKPAKVIYDPTPASVKNAIADLSLVEVVWAKHNPVEKSFMVALEDGSDLQGHLKLLGDKFQKPADYRIDFKYEAICGYSAFLSDAALQEVQKSAGVRLICQNSKIVDTFEPALTAGVEVTLERQRPMPPPGRSGCPWGLQRISDPTPLPRGSDPEDLTYSAQFPSLGVHAVDVYVIDTGVSQHDDLAGRIVYWHNASGTENKDPYEHGTHIAGTIAGTTYGIATRARIISMKVGYGSGYNANVAAHYFDQVWEAAQGPGARRVINFSSSCPDDPALKLWEEIIEKLVDAGVPVCVSAGNQTVPAGQRFPARMSKVITVGSIDIEDARVSDSNYGACVDLYAPGRKIISAHGQTANKTLTGTSFATPHVTGVVAAILGKTTQAKKPEEILSVMQRNAKKIQIRDPQGGVSTVDLIQFGRK